MAEQLKILKRRIKSVISTKQVTRAMEMVSAAKLRRTLATVEAARPYSEKLQGLLARVTASLEGEFAHPLFDQREEKRILFVLFTGDRGLCGAFNSNIIHQAEKFLAERDKDSIDLYCIGKRGADYFRRRGWTILHQETDLRGRVDIDAARNLSQRSQARFTGGDVDVVYLCYNAQVTKMTYTGRIEKFLPLDPSAMGFDEAEPQAVEYEFEPSREAVFAELLPRYCESRLYTTLAETLTAEHSARMLAMNNATKSCEDMMEALTLQMNKARQASITKEILDIVGGAEALKS